MLWPKGEKRKEGGSDYPSVAVSRTQYPRKEKTQKQEDVYFYLVVGYLDKKRERRHLLQSVQNGRKRKKGKEREGVAAYYSLLYEFKRWQQKGGRSKKKEKRREDFSIFLLGG